ncbi:Sodium- and chloride-dependent neutral and basic amino acid transporter B(0+) [Daphnia magna]|uniref:Transporter n=1 Tax=Daphnia magna TaxID=35525 RepID=A0A164Z6D3_9CRUS|nr:Sodium- and chloride-dependent neutral and basic amino acid transporter B(0+) [Daphnia magna]
MSLSSAFSVKSEKGHVNAAFDDNSNGDSKEICKLDVKENGSVASSKSLTHSERASQSHDQQNWDSPIEFLLSCISMSVGLGNIWRFPYVAYENGGGAFLIPYLIVLAFIGRPLYFLEMILGQFSSSGCVKVWSVVPFFKGIGYAQAFASWCVVTYYCVLMALAFFYLFASFQAVLPWTECDPEWATEKCYSSSMANLSMFNLTSENVSSAEEYFYIYVLKKSPDMDSGLGVPDWRLTLCLLLCWILVFATLVKGISSSGKVAYFTALFPYVVLITLLIRGATLPGAGDGMLYFITPVWEKVLTPEVWYAAVTQCFFSLSVGFGPIVFFASYNPFRHPIYRDSTIISFADTGTSVLAGVTIFAILGNLSYTSGKPIDEVVKSGTGLAFVSYPEAISKFDFAPQFFSVLFFLMLITLAVGSAAGLAGCPISLMCDILPHVPRWIVTAAVCAVSFLIGLVYVTPAGQYILDLVDYFGGGFVIYFVVVATVAAIFWIYGLEQFAKDIRFMLGFGLGIYWKFTWSIFIAVALVVIFVYAMIVFEPLKTDNGEYYPPSVMAAGWTIATFAILQIPGWGAYVVYKQKDGTFAERFKKSFRSSNKWGPKNPKIKEEWQAYNAQTVRFSWIPNPKWISRRTRAQVPDVELSPDSQSNR